MCQVTANNAFFYYVYLDLFFMFLTYSFEFYDLFILIFPVNFPSRKDNNNFEYSGFFSE